MRYAGIYSFEISTINTWLYKEGGRKNEKIMFGNYNTLLYQCRTRSADTIKSVCSGIFATYDLDITSYNKELSSHLKSGHDPVPVKLIFTARIANIDCVAEGIEDNLIPSI